MKKHFYIISLVLALSVICTLVLASCANNGDEKGSYILSDKATFLSYKNNPEGDKLPNLEILCERDDDMQNTYTMIAVDGGGTGFASPVTLNEKGADCFIKWMSLEKTRRLISEYGKESYGESLFYILESGKVYTGNDYTYEASGAVSKVINVSTTTSVNDSGLLGYLEPLFEEECGFDIRISSAGTGAAINAAKSGNADMLLVHSKAQEEAFVSKGFARTPDGFECERISFMYNYFVLVGPKSDPVGVKNMAKAADAFAAIKAGGYSFVSRGDNSGTHTKEIALWNNAKVEGIGYDKEAKSPVIPEGFVWYVSTGQGMGASLLVANDTDSKK